MTGRHTGITLVLFVIAVYSVLGCQKTPPPPPTISGTVNIAPELAKDVTPEFVLFVTVRAADAPPFGPPIAAHRMTNLTFPVQYTVTQKDVFFEGVVLEGKVNVYAKLDKDGNAGPPEPGDLEGEHKGNPVMVGATGVDIVIDKIH
jgi:cytochrome c-type biogenesis protein CcmH